jgi:hypothetical protein
VTAGRAAAWQRRGEQATGSRPVRGSGRVGAGMIDDIDALLAEEEPAPEPAPEADVREPYL